MNSRLVVVFAFAVCCLLAGCFAHNEKLDRADHEITVIHSWPWPYHQPEFTYMQPVTASTCDGWLLRSLQCVKELKVKALEAGGDAITDIGYDNDHPDVQCPVGVASFCSAKAVKLSD